MKRTELYSSKYGYIGRYMTHGTSETGSEKLAVYKITCSYSVDIIVANELFCPLLNLKFKIDDS